jgi:hypothetical protein
LFLKNPFKNKYFLFPFQLEPQLWLSMFDNTFPTWDCWNNSKKTIINPLFKKQRHSFTYLLIIPLMDFEFHTQQHKNYL